MQHAVQLLQSRIWFAAKRISVFFTTVYSTPAFLSSLRSLVSSATVMPL